MSYQRHADFVFVIVMLIVVEAKTVADTSDESHTIE